MLICCSSFCCDSVEASRLCISIFPRSGRPEVNMMEVIANASINVFVVGRIVVLFLYPM